MATLVFFHAHPDDESIGTGGSIAKAAARGHRVVLVVATAGEEGNRPPGVVGPGEDLAERRRAETLDAAHVLGVARVEFLGYRDSGMAGAEANDDPASFWAADIEEAAARLAALVLAEAADLLAIYDETGVTGHPDHIKVHQVGRRAAAIVGDGLLVVEGTLSRTQGAGLIRHALAKMAEAAPEQGEGRAPGEGREPGEARAPAEGGGQVARLDVPLDQFGTPDDEITDFVDVSAFLDQKRRAMAAHATQISETSFFLDMPAGEFSALWGQECLICRDDPAFRYDDLLGAAW
ncbi:MAG: PIG-L family deacetylase [Acidimicrobiales bacterium]